MKVLIYTTFLSLFCQSLFGQNEEFKYKRELSTPTESWHEIIIPNDVFGKIKHDLSDIRIIGKREGKSDIEAPYIIDISQDKITKSKIEFELLNQVRGAEGHYYTFEVSTEKVLNEINLNFSDTNFNWFIDLEGSQDQREWYKILTDYRILSINSPVTNYTFSTLRFPDSKYKFIRLLVRSESNPSFVSAEIWQYSKSEGKKINHSIKSTKTFTDKNNKQTIIDVDLGMTLPLSDMNIQVLDTFDYYRPITLKYLVDSTKTPKRWVYNYNTLTTGTLSSLENNTFSFNNIYSNRIKLIVNDQDNQPLSYGEVTIGGNTHKLIVRITEPATYYLMYGNELKFRPVYDINMFQDKIPAALKPLTLMDQQELETGKEGTVSPLFENKAWLWGIMLVIISLLGWFSVRMIRKT